MSFILDALKKSELERQRQTIPGLVDSGPPRPKARLPRWAIAACVLLAVNLIVLSVVLVRGRAGSSAEPAPQTATGKAAPPHDRPASGSGPGDHFSPLDPVYAPEIPVTADTGGSGAEARSAGGAAPGTAAPTTAAQPLPPVGGAPTRKERRHDPVLTNDDYKPADEEALPTINEISLSGAQALPELHLDVHVYATKSADRFVYINMRKYHEGATLEEGPTLERIRRDGVILDYQGLRFILPRQ